MNLGRKSREKQEKLAFRARQQARQQVDYIPQVTKKNGLSNAKKIIIGLTLIAVIVVAASVALSQSPQADQLQTQGSVYPKNVAPVYYTSAVLSSDGNKVTLPSSYVNSSKLVFVDLKLQTPKETLPYQGRTVPLATYRNGEYLPLVIISTPSGKTVAGVRTCEPCGSFSFHIVEGTNLRCDACGTQWTLEDFAPVSGGCLSYPPPKVTSTTNGDSLEIDISALQVQLAA